MTPIHKTPFDVRVVEFHLRNGTITQDEYAKYLNDLADDEDESLETETTFIPAFELRNNSDSIATEDPFDEGLLG